MSADRSGSSYVVSTTLTKAFAIVECIAEHQPVPAAAIRRLVGLSKGNAYHLLASLEQLGYIRKLEDGYRLTFRMFAVGSTLPMTRQLVEHARPIMRRIAEDEGIHVYLTVESNLRMVNLERIEPRSDIQVANDYAVTYELNCTASGKLWLSFMTAEERAAAYRAMSFEARTPNTITDPAALDAQVEAIREQGYAVELMEHSPYINGLAAPVVDRDGRIAASLSVVGPTPILTPQALERLIPRVTDAARNVSRLFAQPQPRSS